MAFHPILSTLLSYTLWRATLYFVKSILSNDTRVFFEKIIIMPFTTAQVHITTTYYRACTACINRVRHHLANINPPLRFIRNMLRLENICNSCFNHKTAECPLRYLVIIIDNSDIFVTTHAREFSLVFTNNEFPCNRCIDNELPALSEGKSFESRLEFLAVVLRCKVLA